MIAPDLHIVTMALRPAGALRAAQSVAAAPSPWPLRHLIVWHHGAPDPARGRVAARITGVFASLPPDAWVFFVDDDNLLHPGLPAALAPYADDPAVGAVIVGMDYHGTYFPARPERLVPCACDGGQVAVRAGLGATVGWRPGPTGDGEFLQALYAGHAARCVFLDRPLSYHNAQHWRATP